MSDGVRWLRWVRRGLLGLAAAAVLAAPGGRSHGQAIPQVGGDWTSMSVETPKRTGLLTNRNLALDGNRNPHIVYGSDALYHAFHDGAQWNVATIDESPGVGQQPTVAIGPTGNVHVCHFDFPNDRWLYTTDQSGTFTTEVLATDQGNRGLTFDPIPHAAIDVDSADIPHVGFVVGLDVTYAVRGPAGGWTLEVIEELLESNRDVSLELDSQDNVHIAYTGGDGVFDGGNITYATNESGRFRTEVVTASADFFVGTTTQLALDAQGNAHIAYLDGVSGGVGYATNVTGGWVLEVATVVGSFAPIAIDVDPQGVPHIAHTVFQGFFDDPSFHLLSRTPAGWVSERLEDGGSGAAIAIDDLGTFHIAHQNSDGLRYIDGTPGSFNAQRADVIGSSGGLVDMARDPSGALHFAYNAGRGVRYATNASGPFATEDIVTRGRETSRGGIRICADAAGDAHVAFVNDEGGQPTELLYATNASGAWVTDVVDTNIYDTPGLMVDSGGTAHVLYVNDAADLIYAKNVGGPWTTEVVESDVSDQPAVLPRVHPDLGQGVDDLYASYTRWRGGNRDVVFATNRTGDWVIETVDPEDRIGGRTSIFADGTGTAYIAYPTPASLGRPAKARFASNATGNWVLEDLPGLFALSPSVVVDGAGAAHVAFGGDLEFSPHETTRLLYSTNVTGVWTTLVADSGSGGARSFGAPVFEVPESAGSVTIAVNADGRALMAFSTAIALDAQGRALVAYDDRVLGDPRLAMQVDNPIGDALRVDFRTVAGTATAGVDYTDVNGTLGWPQNETSPRAFVVDVATDGELEGDETVTLTLTNPVGGTALGRFPSATLVIKDDDIPADAVTSYVLPKNVKSKQNFKKPAKSKFVAAGFFDTGTGPLSLTGPATLRVVPGNAFRIAGLVPAANGRSFRHKEDGLDFLIKPNRTGSGRAKFKLTLRGDSVPFLMPDDEIRLDFAGGGSSGAGHVALTNGRYRLGKVRGALIEPRVFLFAAKIGAKGPGKDSLSFKAGLATLGGAPAQAPRVRIAFGPTFEQTVESGELQPKGGSFRFKGQKGGLTSVVLDYDKELLTVKGKGLDLGAFGAGAQPVVITLEVGDDERTLAVRLGRKGNSLKY